MKDKSTLSIFAKDIYVETRIGILDREKKSTQRLLVSVELFADPVTYLRKVSEKTIIDYDRIYEAVQSWKDNSHTDLIETHMQDLLAVAFSFKKVNAARISIGKPDIYEHAENVGVETYITRNDFRKLRIKPKKMKPTLRNQQKSRQPPQIKQPPSL